MPLLNSFNPNEIALASLTDIDFSVESLLIFRKIKGENTGIPRLNKKELKKLNRLPNSEEIIDNLTKTYTRLRKSYNSGGNPDFAANIGNTIGGTITTHVIDQFSEEEAKRIRIQWIPSSAENADPFHMRFYGKKMSLYRARHLGLGNSKYAKERGYGCQCGCRILSNLKLVNKKDQYQ